jgi:hypothetical protein
MSKIALTRLLFGLVLLATTLSASTVSAAICGRQVTKTYWGWLDSVNSSFLGCTEPTLGPPAPFSYYWGVIGEKETDCNGVVTTWGDTTSCTMAANTTTSSSPCYCVQ